MNRKTIIPILITVLLINLTGCLTPATKSEKNTIAAEQEAVAAAREWLSLIDKQQYEESWEQSAKLFKGFTKKQPWIMATYAKRKPLGKNISRKLKSKRYETKLPGAPREEYVVIEFDASFENELSVIEVITPMLEEDGKWRVTGYFFKIE